MIRRRLTTIGRHAMEHRELLLDPVQATYLDEQCIRVDDGDNVIGSASKRDCHTWENIASGRESLRSCCHISDGLHRAFSVFTFDSRRRLLLQQRAATKVARFKHRVTRCRSRSRSPGRTRAARIR